MKNHLFVLIALLCCSSLLSQTVKIDNGLSYSSMNSNKFDMLNEQIASYSFAIGCDYVEHKFFYLSSEIGYLSKGGKESVLFPGENVFDIEEKWQYIHLNTTIRFKYQMPGSHIFIGLGPTLDVLLGSNKFTDSIYSDGYEMNKFPIGYKAEIGVTQDINRLRVGLSYAYLANLSVAGESSFNNLNTKAHVVSVTFGLKLKNKKPN